MEVCFGSESEKEPLKLLQRKNVTAFQKKNSEK